MKRVALTSILFLLLGFIVRADAGISPLTGEKGEYYHAIEEAEAVLQTGAQLSNMQKELLTSEGIIPAQDDELDQFGGPDDFGYYFYDSEEPNGPEYNWIDISETGEVVVGLTDDNFIGPFDLPFEFSFYGNAYDEVYVCSNGYIAFGAGDRDYTNDPIPSPGTPNNCAFLFWDDLNPPAGGTVYVGEDENGNWVCQFQNVMELGPGSFTGEIVLYSNGNILYQYQGFNGIDINSETIGIENSSGTVGLQVSLNNRPENYPFEELAVFFTLGEENAAVDGVITDAVTEDRLIGVEVRYGAYTATTNEDGYYLIPTMYPGTYTVRIEADTYAPLVETGIVIEEGENHHDFQMEYAPDLEGTLTDFETEEIIPGAVITVSGPAEYEATSDENGYYSIDDLLVGTYSFHVEAEGYWPLDEEIEIEMGMNTYDYFMYYPPEMTVDPEFFTFNVDWGGGDSDILNIGNTGGVDLVYDTHITYLEDELTAGIVYPSFAPPAEILARRNASIPQLVVPGETTGSSSPEAGYQPGDLPYPELDEGPYLVLSTTAITTSVLQALNELEIEYTHIPTPNFAQVDMTDYGTVIVCMDGGTGNQQDFEAVFEFAMDGGTLMFLGGTNWAPYYDALMNYVHHTNQRGWTTVQGRPMFQMVDDTHPLAENLPDTYNYANTSASYYCVRYDDEEMEVVAQNGDNWPCLLAKEMGDGQYMAFTSSVNQGYWSNPDDYEILYNVINNMLNYSGGGRWLSVDPDEGVVEPDHTNDVDIVVDAGEAELLEGTYEALIEITSNNPEEDPANVWVTMVVGSPGQLEGNVVDSDTQEPIEEAEVIAWEDGEFYRSVFTDMDGFYSMSLGEGTWDISADAQDYNPSDMQQVDMVEGETVELTIELDHEIAPEITVDPEEMRFIAEPGGSDSDVLTMINTGGLPLEFSISVEYVEEEMFIQRVREQNGIFPVSRQPVQIQPPVFQLPPFSALLSASPEKRSYYRQLQHAWGLYENHRPLDIKGRTILAREGLLPPIGGNELDRFGGPDGFGYYYFDNEENNGPEFEWLDISETGTLVPGMGDDGYVGPFPMEINFPFYENEYNQIYLGFNGSVGFDGPQNNLGTLGHYNIPSPNGPRNAIQFWQRDMHCNIGGLTHVYLEDRQVNGQNAFVVAYYNLSEYFQQGIEHTISCEIILFEDGKIITQYGFIGNQVAPATMSVGIQNQTGNIGLEYCYNNAANAPQEGTAIGYTLDENGFGGWLTIDPTSGTLDVDEETGIEMMADAARDSLPEDVYEAIVTVESQEGWWGVETGTVWATFIVGAGGVFNPVEPTGLPYSIIVDNAVLNGEELPIASGIGVFDGDLCVGAITLNGEWPRSIVAWEGDPERNLPGFTAGNPMTFRIYNAVDEQEYDAWPTYIRGDGTFGFIGFTEVTLDASEQQGLTIPLEDNYFELISSYIVPEDLDASTVFGDLPSLVIVYQDNGFIFLPPFINTIGNITMTEGYQIFCTDAELLTIVGDPMDVTSTYDLATGRWNWLGYPLAFPVPIETALGEILDQIVIAQTDEGGIFLPPFINTIGNMTPGNGYFIFVQEDVTFQYNQGGLASFESPAPIEPSRPVAVEGAPLATGLPYVVLISMTESLAEMNPAIVELYDGDLLVGKAAIDNAVDPVPVIAWGGSAEYGVSGFRKGDAINIRLSKADGEFLPVRMASDKPVFGEGAYASISLDAVEMPLEFSVGQAYPNPFNPSVTVPFALPKDGEVSFSIFNLLGQQVYNHTRNYQAGTHQLVFDASTDNLTGNELVSGFYFLQVRFDGQFNTQKILLMK